MNRFPAVVGSLAAAVFSACSIQIMPDLSPVPLRAGMSAEEMLAEFGHPLSVERHEDGSQDWFYRFATTDSWSGSTEDWSPRQQDSDEVSRTAGYASSAVHLSPSLRVTGEIPGGQVVTSRRR